MRITVFTSNQPRHLALIRALAGIAEEVFAIQECNTVFPGRREDFFRQTEVMRTYFEQVTAAERRVFGGARFSPANVRTLALRMGDVRELDPAWLEAALQADYFLVFGASFIRGALCDALIDRCAVNIHMGASPYYRGSSTNFWALYDGRPELVGATIHVLTRGLDSGPILFHAFPPTAPWGPFELGMRAVEAAQEAVVRMLRRERLTEMTAVPQDRRQQIRYTRNADFTDDVAREYLERLPAPEEIEAALARRQRADFVRPWVGRVAAPAAHS